MGVKLQYLFMSISGNGNVSGMLKESLSNEGEGGK